MAMYIPFFFVSMYGTLAQLHNWIMIVIPIAFTIICIRTYNLENSLKFKHRFIYALVIVCSWTLAVYILNVLNLAKQRPSELDMELGPLGKSIGFGFWVLVLCTIVSIFVKAKKKTSQLESEEVLDDQGF
ncbi:MAG: hypothetical protein AAFX87_13105 [Bacteroidota bacterium]